MLSTNDLSVRILPPSSYTSQGTVCLRFGPSDFRWSQNSLGLLVQSASMSIISPRLYARSVVRKSLSNLFLDIKNSCFKTDPRALVPLCFTKARSLRRISFHCLSRSSFHYKKIGYNINVLQQTACLVVNPITVGNFAFLFNCTPVGRTSDSMMVPT